MTSPRRAAMRRGRDQCWGFFTEYGGIRYIITRTTRADAVSARSYDLRESNNPGPIFKITGPRQGAEGEEMKTKSDATKPYAEIRALCAELPLFEERLHRIGLHRTAQRLNAAVKSIGYEAAELLERGKITAPRLTRTRGKGRKV